MVSGLVMALCSTAAAEQESAKLDDVVVTATRDEVPIEQVGSSITVITAKEIEQQQKQSVADVLRMVPGLDVVRTGGAGQTTAVYLRGAKSGHTLVLIDGVEMNDSSSLDGGYDFAHLTTVNIERIEILRGPQSTLYGSSAMSGVINIITKRGGGKLKGFVSAEGGSHYTAKETAGLSGGTDLLQYSLGLSRFDSDGISVANSNNGNPENDGYKNSYVDASFGITPIQNFYMDFIFKYLNSKTDIDSVSWSTGQPTDDLVSNAKSEEYYFSSQANLTLFNSFWNQKLGVSLSDINREYNAYNSSYDGQNIKIDWQHILHLHSTNDLTLGAERKEESAKTDSMQEKPAKTTSLYLQDQIKLFDSWFTTIGTRLDDHNQFGTEATYRFTTAYLLKQSNTKIRASYGTGFKAPSLIQLYHPTWGSNAALKPEKSTGWDVGFEQSLADKQASVGVGYFHNDFDQLIDGYADPVTYTYSYKNIAKAESEGVELTASYQPLDELIFHAAYTYTQTKDRTTGEELTRRPKIKLSGDINYRYLGKGNLNLGFIYVGTRNDLSFDPITYTSQTVKLKAYLLVNLAASYDITKNLQLFGRIDNLLDKSYEEVLGYGTPGISAYGGVKVSF